MSQLKWSRHKKTCLGFANWLNGKWSKILNTFLLLFLYKMLISMAGIDKMYARTANKDDPDQTASSEAV